MDSKTSTMLSDRAKKIINMAMMASNKVNESISDIADGPGNRLRPSIEVGLGSNQDQHGHSRPILRPRVKPANNVLTAKSMIDMALNGTHDADEELSGNDSDIDKDWEPRKESSSSGTDAEDEMLDRPRAEIVPETSSDEEEATRIGIELGPERLDEEMEEDATERRCKKRLRKPESWDRNVKKKQKNSGNEYTNSVGVVVGARKLKDRCGEKCRLKCRETISDEDRQNILDGFWNLSDINRQRDYICKCVTEISPQYRPKTPGSTRSLNYAYHFMTNGQKSRVCKTMFMNTLDIGNTFVRTAFKKESQLGFVGGEQRGMHGNQIKLDEAIKQGVRDHINSFDKVESHYCRSETKKEYLDGGLNIATMYRLYKEDRLTQNLPPGKMYLYDTIFRTEFNLSFFKPKKDICAFCESFKNSSADEKAATKPAFDKHIAEKEMSRKEKEVDCANAKETGDTVVSCYDLQSVFTNPCGDVSVFYYKRKLNAYNFTIFDINDKKGFCYMWHEGLAMRGSNEIGTCVFTYLKEECIGKDVIFYSDNCVGQNKNRYVFSMYLHAVKTLDIKSITHKYLIVGHTQNEGDAMHSVIEREKKRTLRGGPVYVPAQWVTVVRSAKKTGIPYNVKEMGTEDFFNLKLLAEDSSLNNFTKDENGDKVVWNNVKVVKIEKTDPEVISYKTSYGDDNFKTIRVRGKRVRGRQSNGSKLVQLYQDAPKIPLLKKKDLLSMCKDNVIPSTYHNFFNNLSSADNETPTADNASDSSDE